MDGPASGPVLVIQGRRLTVYTSQLYRRAFALEGCNGIDYLQLGILVARAHLPLMRSMHDFVQLHIVSVAGCGRPGRCTTRPFFIIVYNCTDMTWYNPAWSSS